MAPQLLIFRRCTTPLSALSSTSMLPVEQYAVAITQQQIGLTRIVPQPSVGQERLNSVIEGLGWLVIGWLGWRRPRRSIDCTDGNWVNSGRGKSLTAGAIQRSYGDIWSLFFDRRKKSLRILMSSLLRPSRTLSRRSWRACVYRLRRLHPRFSINHHAPPVSTSSRSSIPPWYDASFAVQQANPVNSVPSKSLETFSISWCTVQCIDEQRLFSDNSENRFHHSGS